MKVLRDFGLSRREAEVYVFLSRRGPLGANSVSTMLKIGRATGKLPDDAVIIGIEPKTISPGLDLSEELKVKFRELVDMVLKEASITGL